MYSIDCKDIFSTIRNITHENKALYYLKKDWSFDWSELEKNCKWLQTGLEVSYNEEISYGKNFKQQNIGKADMNKLVMK